jgi:adenylosuccinate synthase
MYTDVVVGLQHGDEGKGKVINWLLKNNIMNKMNNYNYCVRYNGGPNAGHTIYNDKNHKFVFHQIPIGIIYGIPSIIGSACVIDPIKLQKEMNELKKLGIQNIKDNLFISYNAHCIFYKHIEDDKNTDKIGSTLSGIRPVYRDKYNRCGSRICKVYNNLYGCKIIDPVNLFQNVKKCKILCEGAQGFELDIDWGDYPYCTSSNCLAGFCNTSGIPPQSIVRIYGVAKIYETYVGKKKFQPNEIVFTQLQKLGNEVGATTGRIRQCNWLNLKRLKRAVYVNGVTHIIINKCDILCKLGIYQLYDGNEQLKTFTTLEEMKHAIELELKNIGYVQSIIFSESKNTV